MPCPRFGFLRGFDCATPEQIPCPCWPLRIRNAERRVPFVLAPASVYLPIGPALNACCWFHGATRSTGWLSHRRSDQRAPAYPLLSGPAAAIELSSAAAPPVKRDARLVGRCYA